MAQRNISGSKYFRDRHTHCSLPTYKTFFFFFKERKNERGKKIILFFFLFLLLVWNIFVWCGVALLPVKYGPNLCIVRTLPVYSITMCYYKVNTQIITLLTFSALKRLWLCAPAETVGPIFKGVTSCRLLLRRSVCLGITKKENIIKT